MKEYLCQIKLSKEEKALALALCNARQITISELFREVLNEEYKPNPIQIETILTIGEIKEQLQAIRANSPETLEKLNQLQTLLNTLKTQLCP
jgi:hypothetical protein